MVQHEEALESCVTKKLCHKRSHKIHSRGVHNRKMYPESQCIHGCLGLWVKDREMRNKKAGHTVSRAIKNSKSSSTKQKNQGVPLRKWGVVKGGEQRGLSDGTVS